MKSFISCIKHLFLSALIVAAHPVWALTASVNKNQFNLGETIQLALNGTSQTPFENFDLTPLSQDFNIIHRSKERRVSIVNGQSSEEVKLNLLLQAKQHGRLIIPSLTVGNEKTSAIQIQVNKASAQQQNEQPVHLTAQWVNAGPAYVQSQLTLKVKIRHNNTLQQGQLVSPQIENAMVNTLGTDITSQENINGRTWQVVERHFAVTPLKSGSLSVAPIQFQGQVARQRNNNSITGYFEPFFGQAVNLQTPPLHREILPPIDTYTGSTWLPAKALTLSAEPLSQSQFKVGDPINLKIDIDAVGLLAEQLPGIQMDALPDSIGVYPDDPVLSNQSNKTDVLGKLSLTIVLIPSVEGDITLPELGVTWWNIAANRQETATLKLPSFTVTKATGNPAASEPQIDGTAIAPTNSLPLDTQTTSITSLNQPSDLQSQTHSAWKWIAISSLLGWLLSTIFLLRRHSTTALKHASDTLDKTAERQQYLFNQVKQHAQSNDAMATYEALQALDRHMSSHAKQPNSSLQSQLTSLGLHEANEQIDKLKQYLFSTDKSTWDTKSSWPALGSGLQTLLKSANQGAQLNELKPLYPS